MNKSLIKDTNLKIIFSITIMAVLGIASLTPAFPKIRDAFGIATENVGLIISAFSLPGMLFTPLLGMMADRFGRRRILAPSLILFSLAGSACFFAADFEILLLLRFLQGVGAASLGALNVTLIGDLYSGEERTKVMGYNFSVLSIGTALSPLLGGMLALIGWNWPFVLPLLGLPVGFSVLFMLKNPEPQSDIKIGEYLSNIFKGVGNRQILGLFVVGLATYIILFGTYLNYLPFLLKSKFLAEPVTIGMFLASMSIVNAITSTRLSVLVKRFGPIPLLATSYLFYIAAVLLMYYVPDMWMVAFGTGLFGVAQALNIPNAQALIASSASLERRGAYMSINRWVAQIGQTVGPFLIGFLYQFAGLAGSFWGGAAVAFIMFFFVIIVIKGKES